MLADTKAELDEFHSASKELEAELEAELARTEQSQQDLKIKVAKAEMERDDWKVSPPCNSPIVACASPDDACAVQVYGAADQSQYHNHISSARVGQATARISGRQGPASRFGDGQRRPGAQ